MTVELKVGGKVYAGFQRARVTRSIEQLAGTFDLVVSDRWWGQDLPWPIEPENACSVAIDGTTVLTGYVDTREAGVSPDDRSVRVSGRDRAGLLCDSSVNLKVAELFNADLISLIRRVCKVHDVSVALATGVKLPAPPLKFSIEPGESGFELINRACTLAGLLPISDGQGGILLTRASQALSPASIGDENALAASLSIDSSQRFHTYRVIGQRAGTDQDFGLGNVAVSATATDPNVTRKSKTLVIHAEAGITHAEARQRAQWEATVRAARSKVLTVRVQGWQSVGSALWAPNTLVPVKLPRLGLTESAPWLISAVTYSLDDAGTTSELTLRPAGAFDPQPQVPPENGRYSELRHGVP